MLEAGPESVKDKISHHLVMRNALAAVLLEPFLGLGYGKFLVLGYRLVVEWGVPKNSANAVRICGEELLQAKDLVLGHAVNLVMDFLADVFHLHTSSELLAKLDLVIEPALRMQHSMSRATTP